MPRKIFELEISQNFKPIWGSERYDWVHILVRHGGYPLGWVIISNGNRDPVISMERLRYAIADQLGWELVWNMVCKKHDEKKKENRLFNMISIVVCTRDRTEQLSGCLKTLLMLDYPDYEIVVVDNAPSSDNTAKLLAHLPVRYIREDQPGLDWARNRGVNEARSKIIAFTDDDVRADLRWLRSINSAFADKEVMAVTGPIAPAEMETDAQIYYELGYGGMMQGLQRRIFKRNELSRRELLWASNFGAGANMAFRRELFEAVGPFDVSLDVGTPCGTGGDLEMFHRIVAMGHTLVYDPTVLVWHFHRRDFKSLKQQLHNNGLGFGAYLFTCARNRTVGHFTILHFALREWFWKWIISRLVKPGWFPRHLVLSELLGALRSPLAYRSAQKCTKLLGTM